jgi:hypothetical protein
MSISTVFVVKNAIKQGYCFWDSLLSCLPISDEIIISEGFSSDNTWNVLLDFKNKYEKNVPITLYRDEWEEKSYHGEVIAAVSSRAFKKATKEYIYYLQADEIIHELNIWSIKKLSLSGKYNSFMFKFHHFIRSWEPSNEGYREAIRMVRNTPGITLKGDAWTFEGLIDPVCSSDNFAKPISHFAWVFPNSNDIKDIEHSKIYANIPEYQDKMKKACVTCLEDKNPYPVGKFNDFPRLAKRFVGKKEYTLP